MTPLLVHLGGKVVFTLPTFKNISCFSPYNSVAVALFSSQVVAGRDDAVSNSALLGIRCTITLLCFVFVFVSLFSGFFCR